MSFFREGSAPTGPRPTDCRIITINIEGITSNAAYIHELLQNNPLAIICIQEHWAFNYQKKMIQDLLPNHCWTIKCVDDEEPISPLYRPSGYGGVACIWSHELDGSIEVLPDGSDRVVALQIKHNKGSLILINSYMPTAGTHTNATYEGVTDEIYEILQKHYPQQDVIWLGDLNADPLRASSSNELVLCG